MLRPAKNMNHTKLNPWKLKLAGENTPLIKLI